METNSFANFAALKLLMSATDIVGDFYVFDVGGNKYRVVAAIHFDKERLYVRHVFTHKEYDQWSEEK
jgi:mRNA interferase HigB